MNILDRLIKIAEIFDKYNKPRAYLDMMERVNRSAQIDNHSLASDLQIALWHRYRFPDHSEVTLLDLVLQELRFRERHDMANELEQRINNCLQLLQRWEDNWRSTVKRNGQLLAAKIESSPGYKPEAGHYWIGPTQHTAYEAQAEFSEVIDALADTHTWLRHYVEYIKMKNQPKRGDTKVPVSVSTPTGAGGEKDPVVILWTHWRKYEKIMTMPELADATGFSRSKLYEMPEVKVARKQMKELVQPGTVKKGYATNDGTVDAFHYDPEADLD